MLWSRNGNYSNSSSRTPARAPPTSHDRPACRSQKRKRWSTELEAEGVVRGYQAVVDWDPPTTKHVRALVELNVTLDRETGYDEIAGRIAKFPAVESLRLVSGDYDFALEVEGDSLREVSKFITEKVAPVPEITQTVTHYIMETYKDRGLEMGDGHDDGRLSFSP